MKLTFRRRITALLLPLLVATLACSISTGPIGPPETSAPTADSEYRYDDLPSPVNEGSAISEFRAIAKWDKLDIAYFFINDTDKLQGDSELEVVRQAFDLWAQQSSLTFTEVSSEAEADLSIGWASGNHGDGDPFDGPGDILAHATFPNPYNDRQVFLHFDDDERWVNSDSNDVDLLTVAAHEIGHTLGLAHSDDPRALMYPSYSGPRRSLGADDVAGVQALYGVASAPQPAPEVPPQGATPPPSSGTDSDEDGISDDEE